VLVEKEIKIKLEEKQMSENELLKIKISRLEKAMALK